MCFIKEYSFLKIIYIYIYPVYAWGGIFGKRYTCTTMLVLTLQTKHSLNTKNMLNLCDLRVHKGPN
jgi:hypothetical protein